MTVCVQCNVIIRYTGARTADFDFVTVVWLELKTALVAAVHAWSCICWSRLPKDALPESPGPVTSTSSLLDPLSAPFHPSPPIHSPSTATLRDYQGILRDSFFSFELHITFSIHQANMAPSKQPAAPPYSKDEKVLCFHHEMLYEAKVIDIEQLDEGGYRYKVHYKGWKSTWDDWVPQDRIRKLNDENRELASQLNQQARASLQKTSKQAGKKIGLKNGSDFSSARGSEERTGATATSTGRGRKRDYELEHVSPHPFLLLYSIQAVVVGKSALCPRSSEA